MQLSKENDNELYFLYADLEKNLFAFRTSNSSQCMKATFPKILKLDLLNSQNLWDYLFLRESFDSWKLDWPLLSNPLSALFDEISYKRASKTQSNDQLRFKAILNEFVLEEITRVEKKIFFERLVSFVEQCNETEDLRVYLQRAANGLVSQFLALVGGKLAQLRAGFISEGKTNSKSQNQSNEKVNEEEKSVKS